MTTYNLVLDFMFYGPQNSTLKIIQEHIQLKACRVPEEVFLVMYVLSINYTFLLYIDISKISIIWFHLLVR